MIPPRDNDEDGVSGCGRTEPMLWLAWALVIVGIVLMILLLKGLRR